MHNFNLQFYIVFVVLLTLLVSVSVHVVVATQSCEASADHTSPLSSLDRETLL